MASAGSDGAPPATTPWASLPPEVWRSSVFPLLKHPKHLAAARLVCKQWCISVLESLSLVTIAANSFPTESPSIHLHSLPDPESSIAAAEDAEKCLSFCARLSHVEDLMISKLTLSSHPLYLSRLPDSLSLLGNLALLKSLILEGTLEDPYRPLPCTRPLPASFSQLRALKLLHLRDMWVISSIDAVCELPSLVELKLRNCSVGAIPERVSQLTNLESLSVCQWEKESSEVGVDSVSLPDSLGDLQSLRVLCLQGLSMLEDLPDCVSRLRNLEELDVSGCSRLCLPSWIQGMTSLKVLALSGCYQLSDDFLWLESLLPKLIVIDPQFGDDFDIVGGE